MPSFAPYVATAAPSVRLTADGRTAVAELPLHAAVRHGRLPADGERRAVVTLSRVRGDGRTAAGQSVTASATWPSLAVDVPRSRLPISRGRSASGSPSTRPRRPTASPRASLAGLPDRRRGPAARSRLTASRSSRLARRRRREAAARALTPLDAGPRLRARRGRAARPRDRRRALELLAEAVDDRGRAGARARRRRRRPGRSRRRRRPARSSSPIASSRTTAGPHMNAVPFTGAPCLRAPSRRERRSFAWVLGVALVVLVLVAAAAPRGIRSSTSRASLPVRSGDMIVLDLSASISSDTFSRIGETLRRARRDSDGRYGLVVFSNVAYEALPPGTPASALRPLDPLLHAPGADGPGRGADLPDESVERARSAAARGSRPGSTWRTGSCSRTTSRRSRVVLISDLADDPRTSSG